MLSATACVVLAGRLFTSQIQHQILQLVTHTVTEECCVIVGIDMAEGDAVSCSTCCCQHLMNNIQGQITICNISISHKHS